MFGRLVSRAGFAASILVALVLSHELVFLTTYGPAYRIALVDTGHDGTWAVAVAVVGGLAAGLFLTAALRLRQLGLVATSVAREAPTMPPDPAALVGRWLGLWPRLGALTTALFVVQENLEHLHAGQGLPGISVLSSGQYPDSLAVIGIVTLVVALVAALFGWRRDLLVARIAAARARWGRAPRSATRRRPLSTEQRHVSVLVHQFAGRAPPQLSTS